MTASKTNKAKAMNHAEEISNLERRREMAVYQRKITTQIFTVWEYDREIADIDEKIGQLKQK